MGLKKCKHTISLLEHQQRQECNMNVSDSYSITWQHGGKLIRNMNYKMAISALRSSSLVQLGRTYQCGIAPLLALLVFFLVNFLQSNDGDCELMRQNHRVDL